MLFLFWMYYTTQQQIGVIIVHVVILLFLKGQSNQTQSRVSQLHNTQLETGTNTN